MRMLVALLFVALLPSVSLAETYPQDVRVKFLENCVKLNKPMINPCKCMLKAFQNTVPFKEFVEISQTQQPERDPRFIRVANSCLNSR